MATRADLRRQYSKRFQARSSTLDPASMEEMREDEKRRKELTSIVLNTPGSLMPSSVLIDTARTQARKEAINSLSLVYPSLYVQYTISADTIACISSAYSTIAGRPRQLSGKFQSKGNKLTSVEEGATRAKVGRAKVGRVIKWQTDQPPN